MPDTTVHIRQAYTRHQPSHRVTTAHTAHRRRSGRAAGAASWATRACAAVESQSGDWRRNGRRNSEVRAALGSASPRRSRLGPQRRDRTPSRVGLGPVVYSIYSSAAQNKKRRRSRKQGWGRCRLYASGAERSRRGRETGRRSEFKNRTDQNSSRSRGAEVSGVTNITQTGGSGTTDQRRRR